MSPEKLKKLVNFSVKWEFSFISSIFIFKQKPIAQPLPPSPFASINENSESKFIIFFKLINKQQKLKEGSPSLEETKFSESMDTASIATEDSFKQKSFFLNYFFFLISQKYQRRVHINQNFGKIWFKRKKGTRKTCQCYFSCNRIEIFLIFFFFLKEINSIASYMFQIWYKFLEFLNLESSFILQNLRESYNIKIKERYYLVLIIYNTFFNFHIN